MRNSLSRILIVFGIVLSILVSVICYAVNAYLDDYTIRQNIIFLERDCESAAQSVDSCVMELQQRTHRVAEHLVVKKFVLDSAVNRYLSMENIKVILSNISDAMPMVLDVRLCMDSDSTLHVLSDTNLNSVVESAVSELFDLTQPFPRISGVTEVIEVNGIRMMAVYSTIMNNGRSIGLLICLIRLDGLLEVLPDEKDCQYTFSRDVPQDDEMYTVQVPLQTCNLTLQASYRTDTYLRQDSDMGQWFVRFAIVSVVLIIIILFFVHHSIVAPVHEIAEQMRRLERAQTQVDVPNAQNGNEIVRLTEGLNSMMEHLDFSTRRMLQMQESMHRVETQHLQEKILFLQSQINPHFLYNTLECLRGMAVVGDTKSIREVTLYMASIYRYCLGQADNVTLREELECVRSYMGIIELRYDGAYTWKNEVSENLYERPVARMMLQPLTENALRHGFLRHNRDEGCITIRAYDASDGLRIQVWDDGGGIVPDVLEYLNLALRCSAGVDNRNTEHIGLYNVNTRIRLLFGENSGLTLFSPKDGGTCVELTLSHD